MEPAAKDQSPHTNRASTALLEIFQSGRPLVYIRSSEEGRVADLLHEAARRLHPTAPIPVWTWSLTEGLTGDVGRNRGSGAGSA